MTLLPPLVRRAPRPRARHPSSSDPARPTRPPFPRRLLRLSVPLLASTALQSAPSAPGLSSSRLAASPPLVVSAAFPPPSDPAHHPTPLTPSPSLPAPLASLISARRASSVAAHNLNPFRSPPHFCPSLFFYFFTFFPQMRALGCSLLFSALTPADPSPGLRPSLPPRFARRARSIPFLRPPPRCNRSARSTTRRCSPSLARSRPRRRRRAPRGPAPAFLRLARESGCATLFDLAPIFAPLLDYEASVRPNRLLHPRRHRRFTAISPPPFALLRATRRAPFLHASTAVHRTRPNLSLPFLDLSPFPATRSPFPLLDFLPCLRSRALFAARPLRLFRRCSRQPPRLARLERPARRLLMHHSSRKINSPPPPSLFCVPGPPLPPHRPRPKRARPHLHLSSSFVSPASPPARFSRPRRRRALTSWRPLDAS